MFVDPVHSGYRVKVVLGAKDPEWDDEKTVLIKEVIDEVFLTKWLTKEERKTSVLASLSKRKRAAKIGEGSTVAVLLKTFGAPAKWARRGVGTVIRHTERQEMEAGEVRRSELDD